MPDTPSASHAKQHTQPTATAKASIYPLQISLLYQPLHISLSNIQLTILRQSQHATHVISINTQNK
jgi:hypothetical protein